MIVIEVLIFFLTFLWIFIYISMIIEDFKESYTRNNYLKKLRILLTEEMLRYVKDRNEKKENDNDKKTAGE